MKMLKRLIVGILGGTLAVSVGVAAQTPDRLTDKDVKTLIDAVNDSRDRFEDQLDGKVKDSILRGPAGEVNVSRFLDDLQENVGRLKDRFKPDYAASTEAAAVLRQATSIHGFMKQQAPGFKGTSEWDHFAGNLTRLAAVYSTALPMPADAAVRRINDGEAAAAAEVIEKQAGQFKDAVGDEKTLAKPAKDGLKKAADVVRNNAKALKQRLGDARPSTAEARQLFESLTAMRASAKGLSPASMSALGGMQASLATLHQAFGMSSPPGSD